MAIHTDSTYRANGKLLLTAEYFVLDGAVALALPTQLGQRLHIKDSTQKEEIIGWSSVKSDGEKWFEAQIDIRSLKCIQSDHLAIANRLEEIFSAIREIQPGFFSPGRPFDIQTQLEFPRDWGLGTSSTLIATLAQWAGIDPYELLQKTFGGSGYDIACANATGPIFYQRQEQGVRVEQASFHPAFHEQLYFVYLGKKQNSRDGIAHYRKRKTNKQDLIDQISKLSHSICETTNFDHFSNLLTEHETLVSDFIQVQPVKEKHFADFWGSVKSLGAWGGDFVLLTSNRSEKETKAYCNEKGFEVFLPYRDLIL